MKFSRVKKFIEAEDILRLGNSDKLDITMACGSDLMSDVLAFTKRRALLFTGLTNIQVIRTAEIAEIAAICFVRGKRPGRDVIKLARKKEIPLISTNLPMYESCGRLYKEGLPGCSEYREPE